MCINYDNFEKSRFFHLEDPPSPIYNAESGFWGQIRSQEPLSSIVDGGKGGNMHKNDQKSKLSLYYAHDCLNF